MTGADRALKRGWLAPLMIVAKYYDEKSGLGQHAIHRTAETHGVVKPP